MSQVITYQRFWMRRGTEAEWAAGNPVLHDGEIGVAQDPGASPTIVTKCKIGDGITAWNSLPWFGIGAPFDPGYNAIPFWNTVSNNYELIKKLPPANGGTGHENYNVGDVLYASAPAVLSRLPAGAATYVLTSAGPNSAPYWAAPSGSSTLQLIKKTSSTTRNNNTLSDDPHLTVALAGTTAYTIRVVLPFTIANATMDFKYRFNYTGTLTAYSITRFVQLAGTAGGTDNQSTSTTNSSINTDLTAVGTGSGDGVVIAEIALLTNGAGTFSVQWAQNTTDAGNCTVYAGASMVVG